MQIRFGRISSGEHVARRRIFSAIGGRPLVVLCIILWIVQVVFSCSSSLY
jgi:hypothetical protein